MQDTIRLPSNRPYLVRAIYEWLTDNAQTPHLIVDADYADVEVPQHLVENGQIVLNIGPTAVRDLDLANDAISFSARFSGRSVPMYVPIGAVMGLISRESGNGMFFRPKEQAPEDDEPPPPQKKAPTAGRLGNKTRRRAQLKVVK